MSYCRWSSDGFRSDVYVYEDVMGGWTTHVAGRKRLGLDTLPQDPYDKNFLKENLGKGDRWMNAYHAYHEALSKLDIVPIGLPHDGQSFNDPTPVECARRLMSLKEMGYYVPQYAIDELLEEGNGTED